MEKITMNEAQNMQALLHTLAELEATCSRLPARCRSHVGNAMLNLSLGYLIEVHGQPGTATILARVVDALLSNQLPIRDDRALDPVRLDG